MCGMLMSRALVTEVLMIRRRDGRTIMAPTYVHHGSFFYVVHFPFWFPRTLMPRRQRHTTDGRTNGSVKETLTLLCRRPGEIMAEVEGSSHDAACPSPALALTAAAEKPN